MKTRVLLMISLLGLQALAGCATSAAKSDYDADGDQIVDALDQCPGTPAGSVVDTLGCPIAQAPPDADGDGVADGDDHCPQSSPGTLIDPQGCAAKIPELPPDNIDSDSDGVIDNFDSCPSTPAGMKVDTLGCVQAAQTLVLRNIAFTPNSSELAADSHAVLDLIAAGLAGQPAMRLLVVGHTDNQGSERSNLKLSQSRAAAVVAYLVERGVAADRLASAGEGERQPVAPNDSEEGRALNRRVEFKVE